MRAKEHAPSPDAGESHARFRAQLFQWREVHPEAHIYALLDPNHPVAPNDPLRLEHLPHRPVSRRIEVVQRPDLPNCPELLPRLLQLYVAGERGYVDESLLDLSLQCATARCRSVNGAYVAAWLCSTRDPAQVAAHIAASGVLFDLSRNERRYVPFFEPHRFALLADDPDALSFLQRWLAPFEGWMFVDASGVLRTVSCSATDLATGGLEPHAAVQREQFAAQDRVGMARFVLLALDRSGIVVARQVERQVDRAIFKAQQQGLQHAEDIVFHALNTFTLGPSWAEHPSAAALIRQAGNLGEASEIRLSDLMQNLPDETLDEIAFASRSASQP